MAAPVPPFFKNFGKSTKDLFKKKYDFDNSHKLVNKTQDGVVFEASSNSAYDGALKAKFSPYKNVEVEANLNTNAKTEAKTTVKAKDIAKGTTVTLGFFGKHKDFARHIYSVDAEYTRDHFAATGVLNSDCTTTHRVDANAAVGPFNGVSLGAQVHMDFSKGAEVLDFNAGAEYVKGAYTASVFTEKNMETLNVAYLNKLGGGKTSFGALVKYDLTKGCCGTPTASVGTEHAMDANTTLKAKVDFPTGVAATAIEHRLANPKLQFGVAAQFNLKNSPLTAEKLGLTFTFGDYECSK